MWLIGVLSLGVSASVQTEISQQQIWGNHAPLRVIMLRYYTNLRSSKSELGMTSHSSLYCCSLEVRKPVRARLAARSNTSCRSQNVLLFMYLFELHVLRHLH